MTDEYVPVSESLHDRYSDILEQHRAEHGDIDGHWVVGNIANWRFADGHILRIDVKDYAEGYFDDADTRAGGSSGSAQPEIDEVTKAQLRQMALAVAAEGSNPDDVVELIRRANYIAAWLATGQQPDPDSQSTPQEAAGGPERDAGATDG